MPSLDFLQDVIPVVILGGCFAYTMEQGMMLQFVKETFGMYCMCNAVHLIWYSLNIHKYFGPWKVTEPMSHLKFAMESSWIVLLFSMQARLWVHAGGVVVPTPATIYNDPNIKITNWEFSEAYQPIKSTTWQSDLFWGILGFYVMDFCRYVAHRVGHYSFFFKTFPFARKYL